MRVGAGGVGGRVGREARTRPDPMSSMPLRKVALNKNAMATGWTGCLGAADLFAEPLRGGRLGGPGLREPRLTHWQSRGRAPAPGRPVRLGVLQWPGTAGLARVAPQASEGTLVPTFGWSLWKSYHAQFGAGLRAGLGAGGPCGDKGREEWVRPAVPKGAASLEGWVGPGRSGWPGTGGCVVRWGAGSGLSL